MPVADPEKRKRHQREWYARNKDKAIAKVAAYRHKSPEARERWRAWKRNHRQKNGARTRAAVLEGQLNRLAEKNAKQAWSWWLKTCPDWWMRAYHRALGKPWNNPRISGAEKWRIRYWCDPAYRAKEIEKVQTLKVRRAERIASNNDGTLTGEVIVSLFATATHCIYCYKAMRSTEKSLDHVAALSKGGAHSISNVVVCCKTCNNAKGTKTLTQSVSAQLICGGA
jgi:5-methylcytosine-specific restriction endonuclease McrA